MQSSKINGNPQEMKWTADKIRQQFLSFFEEKAHQIVPSDSMVIKNDPTLMFTNAGMNQFKDVFLGNNDFGAKRVTDTQKCLRVSGKHNDLEEVGVDTYHHTMFEMLGNWSFGDYFKQESIEWAWELLVDVYGIDKSRLYATYFAGDEADGLGADEEAKTIWLNFLSEERVLACGRSDNFWEMGDIGPCGPCSEIHIDLRSDEERNEVDGKTLVNADHPQVVEIWNLVFMQYNRRWKDAAAQGEFVAKEKELRGSLKPHEFKHQRPGLLSQYTKLEGLPAKHVDTGMGFERLAMVLQGKVSNYDTDVFSGMIAKVESISGKLYGKDNSEVDIAIRVIVDHIRAISFSIADGQLPSNTGAGYVIRRILRRAVRYGYSFLGLNESFLSKLVSVLVKEMGNAFPELKQQEELITKVILEEEEAFLRTLDRGISRLNEFVSQVEGKTIAGAKIFELYDTYGFPFDLTALMLKEKGIAVDEEGYLEHLQEQKNRSRNAGKLTAEDWIVLKDEVEGAFVGYDNLVADVEIVKYRKVNAKGKEFYQLVFNQTPFYPEGGGQVGDSGIIEGNNEKITILDTKKENTLIVHKTEKLPANLEQTFKAIVNQEKRRFTASNHSATHLLHHALRKVLGAHVEQKGSYVGPEYLRFDFSHFSKVQPDQLLEIEKMVNEKVIENITLEEQRQMDINEAMDMGAMALFGEKYGAKVRVVKFGESVELCGGTHVTATGEVGFFKILNESAVAAGIRRIEAVSSQKAQEFIYGQLDVLEEIKTLLKQPADIRKSVKDILDKNNQLQKELEKYNSEKVGQQKESIIKEAEQINGVNFIGKKVELDPASMKNLAFQLKDELENMFILLGAENQGKANLVLLISENLTKEKDWNAGSIIRDLAKQIKGGGGGQAAFASAGGSDANGLVAALEAGKEFVS